MAKEIILPKMGDAMSEGIIVQWYKNLGDTVKKGDVVTEIETDKSNVEIEAESDGIVEFIGANPGDVVPVGTVIMRIGDGSNISKEIPHIASVATPTPPPLASDSPPLASEGEAKVPVTPVAPVILATSGAFKPYGVSFVGQMPENLGGSASTIGEPITLAGEETTDNGRVKATPLARAIAAANGVNLSSVSASNGAVTAADVQNALGKPASSTPVSGGASVGLTGTETQAFNKMRQIIAKRLLESKTTIPHFYVTAEIDMEALITLRGQINSSAKDDVQKVSVNDCLLKAVAVALGENPKVNAKFENNSRVVSHGKHIGFGVSVDDGLIVPVVRNCEAKSVREIALTTKPLIEKARAGKLSPADYTGGTFTISNMGVFPDIENFAAIINPGEGAILAVSSTREVPAVIKGQVVPRKRMKVTLSADHRVVDGADGAQFLISLKRVLENPLEILL
jgi:pyruvate dehydrogenase E2 component (dihydrolipoamide acetyltransferase)